VSLLSSSPQLTVGFTSPGLLATISDTGVRFTEFYASSFQGRSKAVQEGADTGTSLIVQFSGFANGLAIAVPNAIAGSSATTPTASGNFGIAANPGQYTPGTPGGSLLLSLVNGADSNGAGGAPLFAPTGTATITLSESTPVTSLPIGLRCVAAHVELAKFNDPEVLLPLLFDELIPRHGG